MFFQNGRVKGRSQLEVGLENGYAMRRGRMRNIDQRDGHDGRDGPQRIIKAARVNLKISLVP